MKKRTGIFYLLITIIHCLFISRHGAHKDENTRQRKKNDPDYHPPSSQYNIMYFGAKGDGVSDDSKALASTWKEACKVSDATIEIPSGYVFLLKPLNLQGPCMPNLCLQIDGTVLAPTDMASWSKSSLFQWIKFKWLSNLTVRGSGTFDGQGSSWWNTSISRQKDPKKAQSDQIRPTVIRFYKSYNITVSSINIINSPQCHLKFDNSRGINIKNITISSPQESPNTDGIHLQNTQNVEIKHSYIGSGDDCVSIQTGCSNIHIHHLHCNPSHGISIGGLGRSSSLACVSNITVENVTIQSALSGVRIKTWQGGVGSVKNITFSNVQVSSVEIPIMIDQYYCNKRSCKNRTDAVAISNIKYRGITGTYTYQPVHLACSDSTPCIDISLIDVSLSPISENHGFQKALCWNLFGEAHGSLQPSSIGCLLRSGGRAIRALTKSYNYTC